MTLTRGNIDAFGRTDVGKVRTVNQDQFLIASLLKLAHIDQTSLPDAEQSELTEPGRAALLMVADGVGGQQAGEKASETALQTVAHYVSQAMRCYYTVDHEAEERFLEELRDAVMRTHDAVLAEAEKHPEQAGMATTLTLLKVLGRRGYVVQVGDSRLYLRRGDTLSQVTRDQTVAQDLIDQGVMSEATAEHSPFSHILSSAIGGKAYPEIYTLDLEAGDVVLLCTDGLNKHVADEEIAHELGQADPVEAIGTRLVDMALQRGASDNVTVIVGRVPPPEPGAGLPPDAGALS